jgi:hypothetical protein
LLQQLHQVDGLRLTAEVLVVIARGRDFDDVLALLGFLRCEITQRFTTLVVGRLRLPLIVVVLRSRSIWIPTWACPGHALSKRPTM